MVLYVTPWTFAVQLYTIHDHSTLFIVLYNKFTNVYKHLVVFLTMIHLFVLEVDWFSCVLSDGVNKSFSANRMLIVYFVPFLRFSKNTGSSKKMDGIWNRYNLKSTGRIYTFCILKYSEKFKVSDLP